MIRPVYRVVLSCLLGCVVGCAAPLLSGSADPAMKLKDPDAAFMKKVEKDPFPRAAGAGLPQSLSTNR